MLVHLTSSGLIEKNVVVCSSSEIVETSLFQFETNTSEVSPKPSEIATSTSLTTAPLFFF